MGTAAFRASAFALAWLAVASAVAAQPREVVDLSGPGWTLWLDEQARWQDEELFLPGTPLSAIPARPPTGGWQALDEALRGSTATPVAVPGTVEEYLMDGKGPAGDIKGVSWWVRTFTVPAAAGPRRVALQFDSVRERAEVFVDGRLVHHDLVGSTPFEVDVTDAVRPGATHRLAVRVTDPGGNFDWRDSASIAWGRYRIPGSHGFGGITGRVQLVSRDVAYVDDVYVQNTPAITAVNVFATLRNATSGPVTRDVVLRVLDAADPSREALRLDAGPVTLEPGERTIELKAALADATPWTPDTPHLYLCEVTLLEAGRPADVATRRFGFRWFDAEGIGDQAVFRLNGKRIVLRSAINWGFWPTNGIYPTPELARREIQTAKDLGLNMLNAHRAIGPRLFFDLADEMGLLTHAEPGNYVSGDVDLAFTQKLMREKWLRMVKRDRSAPSLVIRNMINEGWGSAAGMEKRLELLATRKRDLRDAHALDPSRIVTHTSAWAPRPEVEDLSKMHMRPFDDTLHMNGWYDVHHAEGPDTWNDGLYKSPTDFYLNVHNPKEIVFWGEEAAISTPMRIGSIAKDVAALPRLGWDGAVFLDWNRTFEQFLDRKGLRDAFPTVDALTTAMAAISLEHQGRKIEQIRLHDQTDGYVVNGWESQITENHSGIVDAFRRPKADPALMARYNRPLFVAVKLRSQVAPLGAPLTVDVYIVNERDVRGPHTLEVVVRDAAGAQVSRTTRRATVTGGEKYGELLAEAVTLATGGTAGIGRVEARLLDDRGAERASGHDEYLSVDWQSAAVAGSGALWETANPRVRRFLEGQRGLQVPAYADALGRLDWVVVARSPNEGTPGLIPADRLRQVDGTTPGVQATFFRGRAFDAQVHRRVDANVSLEHEEGATPDPNVPLTAGYSVRFEGQVIPVNTGTHGFVVEGSGGIRLTVNGKVIIDNLAEWFPRVHQGVIDLAAGQPATFLLEFSQRSGASRCRLLWSQPERDLPDVGQLLERVRRDGTTLIVVDRADTWMEQIAKATGLRYEGSFKQGRNWLGGVHFVREHPLFADLPTNVGMNWPYQAVVRDGHGRVGLVMEGEHLVAGLWHSYPMQLGAVVAVVPHGKGRIVLSTLDIVDNLGAADGPSHVARKLLVNFIRFAR